MRVKDVDDPDVERVRYHLDGGLLREAGVPAAASRCLAKDRRWSPTAVAGLPDAALLRVAGIGRRRLAAIRAAIPYDRRLDPHNLPPGWSMHVAGIDVWEEPPVVREWVLKG